MEVAQENAAAFAQEPAGTDPQDGSRRDLLNEGHLKRILGEFIRHYNRGRLHSSLGSGIPEPYPDRVSALVHRHVLPVGYRIRAKPVLGGLHYEYSLEKEAA